MLYTFHCPRGQFIPEFIFNYSPNRAKYFQIIETELAHQNNKSRLEIEIVNK